MTTPLTKEQLDEIDSHLKMYEKAVDKEWASQYLPSYEEANRTRSQGAEVRAS